MAANAVEHPLYNCSLPTQALVACVFRWREIVTTRRFTRLIIGPEHVQKTAHLLACKPRKRVVMDRKDWTLGRWHLIRRTAQTTQYGWQLWSLHGRHTFDVWIGQTLWTLRRHEVD